ncbi:MAG: 3-oxoacyl-ACP reductase FabG [Cupriavidus sp.]|nr:3-oxoacyl-ACP reductase FabG [Cupriavidus sp.]
MQNNTENPLFVDLRNRLIVVTGGSRGIGRAIVEQLASCGAGVVFTYHTQEEVAKALACGLQRHDMPVWHMPYTAGNAPDAAALIARIEDAHGPIHGLVNNAGITRDGVFVRNSTDAWDAVLDVNLHAPAYLLHAALDPMMRRGAGRVVNMASISGLRGAIGQANYSASKAALIALTRTTALEMARFGIQINAVAPGFIDTDILDAMPAAARAAIPSRVPARRMGRPEEVACAVAYLLSDAADYITGHTLVIDGGLNA